ncbi:MAG TPA: ATP-binding protein, partial [Methylophilaceae bacterium]|nr:ATP-binding protein [Methylophilaceae bacterium]
MWHNPSLKKRLLAMVLGVITLVWLGASVWTYFDAREELDEMLDAHLTQTASLLLTQTTHELDELETEHAPQLHKYSRRVAFQVWEQGRDLRLHSVNAPQQPLSDKDSGFSDRTLDNHRWRVFSAWDDSHTYLIHVAEQAEVREKLARGVAANLLRPLLVALPLLAILLWLAVASGLRPLVGLARQVGRREPDNLAALDAGSAPDEVIPLIERLNTLFHRINASIQSERRFTADAAHELRTPIAVIKAQSQVARNAANTAERSHALDGAIAGCDRAAHLIEQLLTLARLDSVETGSREPCPLRQLAAETLADIAPAALDKGVQLELAEGDEVTVNGLPALLRVMLRNLLDNAVRHTPPGTLVRVEISASNITVSDNGPGLPEQELEKISQRFYRPLGTEASGSGLGLSIVRRIAEMHDTQLTFTSASTGKGLRATV